VNRQKATDSQGHGARRAYIGADHSTRTRTHLDSLSNAGTAGRFITMKQLRVATVDNFQVKCMLSRLDRIPMAERIQWGIITSV